jgi:hypothetical protein
LVAAADRLVRIGLDGNPMFDLAIGDTVVAPPVADAEGNLYAASEDRLFRIE